MSDIRHEVAEAIKALRSSRGLTQRDAAVLLRWSQPSLSRIEGGYYNPTIRILEHIAKSLNVQLEVKFTPMSEAKS